METFTDDTIVALASFLSPHDMLSLAITCKRFGDKHGTDTKRSIRMAERESRKTGGREVRQRTESISLMEVAARTVLFALATDEEYKALPRREDKSWIGIYQEFQKLFCLPLQFDKVVGRCMNYVDNSDKTTVCPTGHHTGTAICSNIMKAGKHSVSFQIINQSGASGILIGIMRPTTKDITSLEHCHPVAHDLSSFSLKKYEILHTDNNIDCCVLGTRMGNIFFCNNWIDQGSFEIINDWDGKEPTEEVSFKVGMILDLDEGSLDVYKNDRRLGTMKNGLVGEYCWAVSLHSDEGAKTVSINR